MCVGGGWVGGKMRKRERERERGGGREGEREGERLVVYSSLLLTRVYVGMEGGGGGGCVIVNKIKLLVRISIVPYPTL